jgi:hypothetical protein
MKTKKITSPTRELTAKIVEACPYEWCAEDGAHTCVPTDIALVSAYAATITREENTLDGSEFEGVIYKDGVAILEFMNDGWGGPNTYWYAGDRKELLDEFVAVAKRAFPSYEYDPADVLAEFLVQIGEVC